MRTSGSVTEWAIVAMVIGLCAFFGAKALVLILLIRWKALARLDSGFSTYKHQFEGAYWERGNEWDYMRRRCKAVI